MAELTPDQLQLRERIESLIRFSVPALDFVLACGDRMSRMLQPTDPDFYPVRTIEEDFGG